jgi:hypothetical protein
MRVLLVPVGAVALSLLAICPALSQPARITRAFIGTDGLAHVERNGGDRAIAKEPGQAAVDSLKVASDGRTVGWLVKQDNCCTSYPIPTRLVVIARSRKFVFSQPQMIYDWYFLGDGEQVALSIGPTHGEAIPHFLLYDTHSGRKLEDWSVASDTHSPPPSWTSGLRQ